jgi:hypothetical protein
VPSRWRLEPFVGPADSFNPQRHPVELPEEAGQRERRYVRAVLRGLGAALEPHGGLTVHVTAWGDVNEKDGGSGDSLNLSAVVMPSDYTPTSGV